MATYSVLEKVNGGTFNRNGLNTTATRVFTVTRTDAALCSVEEAQNASGIPSANSAYSGTFGVLQCQGLTVKAISPNFVEVTANYGVGNFIGANVNPLLEPAIITWELNTSTEEIDRDINKKAIVNAVGDPVPGCQNNFYIDVLKCQVNLSTYTLNTWRAYRNTVNSDTLTSSSLGLTILPGYARCVSVQPVRSYRVADNWVPHLLTLEIADSNQPSDPFQERFINQGKQAYYYDANDPDSVFYKKGRIVWKDSLQPVDNDVLLDSTGMPDVNSYRVWGAHGQKGFYPIPNPSLYPGGSFTLNVSTGGGTWSGSFTPPAGCTFDTSVTGVVYCVYTKSKSVAFTGIGNLFGLLGL